MTYCVGIMVHDGLVMIADTRTNAGVDNISVFRKLHLFQKPEEYVFALATAGNLAVSQSVLTLLSEGFHNPDTGESETLVEAQSMFKAAQMVGRAIREVHRVDGISQEMAQSGTFDVTVLLGGQVRGGRLRLFMVYSAGNFIEATADTPYLQIGEHKYGKPILDRAVTEETELYDALKIGLISMDSTIRSNLSVGLPIDLLVLRRDAIRPELTYRIDEAEPYFHDLREHWSAALREAHLSLPTPPYPRETDASD
ncbi:peptidase [Bauldia litoralis]|uniref:Putative proteasome-type protease n=1 Tax=Bauldia litoralis TaxID=665467 RepID=A0A1G6DKG7_9HYPH|nr:peptidase [Bauldia litoralis]SDB45325.1 putative proteasome-type protease [Bauldia litoralis]